MNCKYKNLWSRPPATGDLVEIGYDSSLEKPFIGVITQLKQEKEIIRKKAFGCILLNGVSKWCNIYDLKPASQNVRK